MRGLSATTVNAGYNIHMHIHISMPPSFFIFSISLPPMFSVPSSLSSPSLEPGTPNRRFALSACFQCKIIIYYHTYDTNISLSLSSNKYHHRVLSVTKIPPASLPS